ncbi:MAG: mechanosensitive ion channel [Desulfarculus sp.]|nr:mechanosensitive ion channel [Pseudomonadota bacterium]MBV1714285.1 mechanosensitive ion channel [Desulfarculus sp.]MBU4576453.1 mechanosensitive ion channel [Pseudomonadota bacterium]MBU4596964.1 mechanosensitive ion channel [Pseudomonadota bacterium]MBV1737659.1 mechanosensitive ion channel [Desulfarculus sp.]
MDTMTTYVTQISDVGNKFGPIVVKALILLVIVLFLTIFLGRVLANLLVKFGVPERRAAMSVTGLHIIVLFMAALVVLNVLGFPGMLLFRTIVVILMVLVAAYIIAKPYIPRLPLKKGDTVGIGGKVGNVEAVSIMYTQLKTFDGKVVFIPNHKVMNDQVVNFSAKPKRRVDIDFFIPYDQDLAKVKKVVMDILEGDERVLDKPAPKVVIARFSPNYREMQARFWVARKHAITGKWSLNEVIDNRFAEEGIAMAAPRLALVGSAPAREDTPA